MTIIETKNYIGTTSTKPGEKNEASNLRPEVHQIDKYHYSTCARELKERPSGQALL